MHTYRLNLAFFVSLFTHSMNHSLSCGAGVPVCVRTCAWVVVVVVVAAAVVVVMVASAVAVVLMAVWACPQGERHVGVGAKHPPGGHWGGHL